MSSKCESGGEEKNVPRAQLNGAAWGERTAKFGVHVKGEILLRRRLRCHRRCCRPPSDAAGEAGNG